MMKKIFKVSQASLFTALCFFGALLLGSGCASRELPDPSAQIPPDNEYRNETYGFRLYHARILERDISDRGYDGMTLRLLYPGSGTQVFALDIVPATKEQDIKAGAIPGSNETTTVAGLPAETFTIKEANGEVQKTLLKKDGWLYVLEGKSDTFRRIRNSFSFE